MFDPRAEHRPTRWPSEVRGTSRTGLRRGRPAQRAAVRGAVASASRSCSTTSSPRAARATSRSARRFLARQGPTDRPAAAMTAPSMARRAQRAGPRPERALDAGGAPPRSPSSVPVRGGDRRARAGSAGDGRARSPSRTCTRSGAAAQDLRRGESSRAGGVDPHAGDDPAGDRAAATARRLSSSSRASGAGGRRSAPGCTRSPRWSATSRRRRRSSWRWSRTCSATDLTRSRRPRATSGWSSEFGSRRRSWPSGWARTARTVANALRLLRLPDGVRSWSRRAAVDGPRARAARPRVAGGDGAARAAHGGAGPVGAQGGGSRPARPHGRRRRRPKPATAAGRPSANARDLGMRLTRALGTRVDVNEAAPGRGHVAIHYHSLDQLDALIERIVAPR